MDSRKRWPCVEKNLERRETTLFNKFSSWLKPAKMAIYSECGERKDGSRKAIEGKERIDGVLVVS
jgi:hypothetical protein